MSWSCLCSCKEQPDVISVERAALPEHLHCFPTTPEHGFDIARARAHTTPVWICLQLLNHLSLQQFYCPTFALNAWSDSLLEHHKRNGSIHIGDGGCVSSIWFAKLAGAALLQFRIIEHERLQRIEDSSRMPQIPEDTQIAPCIACAMRHTLPISIVASSSHTWSKPAMLQIRSPRYR